MLALKPVDTNKLREPKKSKSTDGSTSDSDKSQKDFAKLTKLEKNCLKSLAKKRKEVVTILEIMKDTISKNYSNYSPIVSMLMSKDLRQRTRSLEKELSSLK